MSSSLVWRAVKAPNGSFNTQLKRALGAWKFGGDGSIWESSIVLTAKDIEQIEVMKALGVSEAGDLIDAIYKHGAIELWLEY